MTTYVGFRLPAGVPIISPLKGQANAAQLPPRTPGTTEAEGVFVLARDPNGCAQDWGLNFTGDLAPSFPLLAAHNIAIGDRLASTTNTGTTNLGDFTLILTASRANPAGGPAVGAEEVLQRLFPAAFAATVLEVEERRLPGATPRSIFTGTTFYSPCQ